MTITLTDEGAEVILKAFFNNTWDDFSGSKILKLRLYTNRTGGNTPDDEDTRTLYEEAAGGGYGVKDLTIGVNWTVSGQGTDPNKIFQAACAEQTWTFSGQLTNATNKTIQGYYVETDGTTPKLVYAEQFSATMTPQASGDQLKFTPLFKLSKGTPT